jgi:hypothetical protein
MSEDEWDELIRDASRRTTFHDRHSGGTWCVDCGLTWTFPPWDPGQPCPRCEPEASRVYQAIHHSESAEALEALRAMRDRLDFDS